MSKPLSPTQATRGANVTIHLPVRWPAVGWGLSLLVLGMVVLYLLSTVRTVTVPLLVALALAYLVNPVVDFFERRGIQRALAIVALMLTFALGIVLLVICLGPRLVHEASLLPQKLGQAMGEVRPWVRSVLDYDLPDSVADILATLQNELLKRQELSLTGPARELGTLLRIVFGGTVSALATFGSLMLVPLFLFFFLQRFHSLLAHARALCPPWAEARATRIVHEIDAMLSGFIRGQLIMGLILTVLYSVGFFLVDLPLALMVGLMTGLGNMVPFVGTSLGLIVATLMGTLSWQGLGHLFLIYGVFAVVHMMEAWFITPRIVGARVGLSPFLTILAVLMFGEMLGFFGILIAVPTTAVLKIVGRHVLMHYRESAFYRGATAQDSLKQGPDVVAL